MTFGFFLSILLILSYILSAFAVVQCLLRTKYPQAALAWCGVILMLPFVGSVLFFIFGVNRIDSRAAKLFAKAAEAREKHLQSIQQKHCSVVPTMHTRETLPIMAIGERRQGLACVGGNFIEPLFNGDEAYPRMLEAINNAKHHVFLSTYIFSGKESGAVFADALIDAHKRGVMVRVIVDGIGSYFGSYFLRRKMKKAGVLVFSFIPLRIFPFQLSINLRNHRKLLICDDVAFTGGMNISDGNILKSNPSFPIQDLHFSCRGPIAAGLREAFLLDLAFVTEKVQDLIFDSCPLAGCMDARMIMDGPGNDDDLIINVLCGVFSCAKKEIIIINPYFLPTREVISALVSAVLRGVSVKVILPEKLDHCYVSFAADHILPGLLEDGIKIYKQPEPFAHTKLVLIDDDYTFLGSTNFDPRSLKLNFELNLEVFSPELNSSLRRYAENVLKNSREILSFFYTEKQNTFLGFLARIRNAAMWIFSPYL